MLASVVRSAKSAPTIAGVALATAVAGLKMARAFLGGPVDPVRVVKVLAFNESQAVGESYSEAFRPDLGLELAQAQLPWTSYRIEVRYEYNGDKYRIVYHQDDAMEYPPRKAFGFVRAPHLVRATCVPFDGVEYDVTARVRKYAGPERDFHVGKGTRVRVWDMFPYDDHEYESTHVKCLRLEWSDGTVGEFDYASNQAVSAPSDMRPVAMRPVAM